MSYGELVRQLNRVQDVLGYKEVDLTLELEWAFDDYYVNVWEQDDKVAEHLSSKGDFEKVWEWLASNYPEADWDEQDF